MLETHQELRGRLASLRDARDHPVYLLEHGLSKPEAAQLTDDVREAIRDHPPSSDWWQTHPLPLLVVATEVGYMYRGTGTDFWPRLSARLGCSFEDEDRRALSQMFAFQCKSLRGVTPPDTPWSRAFCHIAWPITHAILPVEFHHPLASALLTLDFAVDQGTPTERIAQALRSAAQRCGGVRFETWLQQSELAANIVRQLLGQADLVMIEPSAAERLRADLVDNTEVANELDAARSRQRRLSTQRRSVAIEQTEDKLIGALRLHAADGQLRLYATLPALPDGRSAETQQLLRRRRCMIRPFGVGRPIVAERVLSGLPLPLDLERWPATDVAFLPDLDGLGLGAGPTSQLARLCFDTRLPVLLRVADDGEVATQVRSRGAVVGPKYWVLTGATRGSIRAAGTRVVGEPADVLCVEVDTTVPPARSWLQSQGCEVRSSTNLRVLGDPPLSPFSRTPEHTADDAVFIRLTGLAEEDLRLSVSRGGQETAVEVSHDCVLELLAPDANGLVELRTTDGAKASVAIVSRRPPPEVCWIEAFGEALSTTTLLQRDLAVHIGATCGLYDVPARASLSWLGTEQVVGEARLPSVPATLGAEAEIWRDLLTEQVLEQVTRQPEVTLCLDLGGIACRSWLLEREVKDFWWETDERGSPHALSDGGPLETWAIPARAALAPPAPTPHEEDGLYLLVARSSDRVYLAGGVCVGVASSDTWDLARPARLLRQRRGSGAAVGLEQLIEAYIAWQAASAVALLADLQRRRLGYQLDQWVAETVCGERWVQVEFAPSRRTERDPWSALISACREMEVGFDPVVTLSPDEETRLRTIVVTKLRERFPDLWQVVEVGAPARDDWYEGFDDVFAEAYEEMSNQHFYACRLDRAEALAEADPGSPPEEWRQALHRAYERATAADLSELVYPTGGGDELRALHYGAMSTSDIVEELDRWSARSTSALQGRRWSREELEVCFLLWTNPGEAEARGWRSLCDRLLTDRCTARAVRYAAVRARAMRSLMRGEVT